MESHPKFHNENGVPMVRIGCREFKCIGQGWDSGRSDDFSADTSGGNREQDSHTTYQQDAE
jgi:hypothetical protein